MSNKCIFLYFAISWPSGFHTEQVL
nr:unnamed protein product [Callosobruchus chinensis]